jgi:pimeloyl-ACP methyl ester carboxylesterase
LILSLLLALGAAAVWQALHRPPTPVALANGARLEWVDCWFAVAWLRPVHCGRLTTGEDPGLGGPPFVLPVVYVPARPWERMGGRTLYIAGGPGGATQLGASDIPAWLEWLDEVGWTQDTVFYDQRGVGLAQPRIDCPELAELRRRLLPLDLETREAGERLQAAGRACKRRHERIGVDFRRFDTPANARDARDLMATLGGGPWNLYGVSYGTRVALEVMREAPEGLRAVVLDSAFPPKVHAELADPWLLDRLFALVSRVCELLETCESPDEIVATDLDQALAQLRSRPLLAEVPDPAGLGRLKIRLGDEDFAWLLFEAAYRWDLLPRLPAYAAAAAGGHLTPALQGLISDSVRGLLDDSVSDAVAAAVDCNDAPVLPPSRAEAMRQRYPAVASLLEHDWELHFCRFWKTTDAGERFRAPVHADVPTLVLAGEFDPVTPPEWSAAAAADLRRAFLFEFPGIGHGVLDSHDCAVEVVRAFFARPEAPQSPPCLADL